MFYNKGDTMQQQALHGGDIYSQQVQYDFSVNENPLGIANYVRATMKNAVNDCRRYPQYGSERLREAIAQTLGVRANQVLCGNGASELFAAIVHAFRPKKVVIPQPAFYGYEWAAQMVDAQICHVELKEEASFFVTETLLDSLEQDVELLFLASPSNPVGNRIPSERLERILQKCREKAILVVLDECFIEFTGEEGALAFVDEYPNLILVRAFTKTYAMPGVRLGYLVGAKERCEQIAKQLPEWNVSVLAQQAGLAILTDVPEKWIRKQYLDDTTHLIQEEKKFLIQELICIFGQKMKIFASDANFLLLRTGVPIYKKLLEQGILIRDCSNYRGLGEGYYRIAVRTHEENVALVAAMRGIDVMQSL
jgi:histidinol-phosphate aminotransferase